MDFGLVGSVSHMKGTIEGVNYEYKCLRPGQFRLSLEQGEMSSQHTVFLPTVENRTVNGKDPGSSPKEYLEMIVQYSAKAWLRDLEERRKEELLDERVALAGRVHVGDTGDSGMAKFESSSTHGADETKSTSACLDWLSCKSKSETLGSAPDQ